MNSPLEIATAISAIVCSTLGSVWIAVQLWQQLSRTGRSRVLVIASCILFGAGLIVLAVATNREDIDMLLRWVVLSGAAVMCAVAGAFFKTGYDMAHDDTG